MNINYIFSLITFVLFLFSCNKPTTNKEGNSNNPEESKKSSNSSSLTVQEKNQSTQSAIVIVDNDTLNLKKGEVKEFKDVKNARFIKDGKTATMEGAKGLKVYN